MPSDKPHRSGRSVASILEEAAVIPGVKVDLKVKAHDLALHPGESVTEGLDGLRGRLQEYRTLSLRFTKWRAVIAIDENLPSSDCIEANAHAIARFAALSQEAGLVPIVEPEMLMEGTHTMKRCREVSERVLRALYRELAARGCFSRGRC